MIAVCAGFVSSCTAGTDQPAPAANALVPEPELLQSDLSLARSNLQNALETKLSGNTVRWRNAASGAQGSITPVRTWKTTRGIYCRSYNEIIRPASGQSIRRQGVACRSSDAVWETV